ncbi:MAG: hypothetical protein ABR878_03780 [Roseiarcus sp.]
MSIAIVSAKRLAILAREIISREESLIKGGKRWPLFCFRREARCANFALERRRHPTVRPLPRQARRGA